jgi:hypothetical protein
LLLPAARRLHRADRVCLAAAELPRNKRPPHEVAAAVESIDMEIAWLRKNVLRLTDDDA